MKKAVLVLEGVNQEEVERMASDTFVVSFLRLLAKMYRLDVVMLGAGSRVQKPEFATSLN